MSYPRVSDWFRVKSPVGVVQVDRRQFGETTFRSIELPEHTLRLAQAEYERQYGTSQDYEKMQRRGGLSVLEVIGLLSCYLDRLGAQPTKPRDGSHE